VRAIEAAAGLRPEDRAANGVPEPEVAAARERAAVLAAEALAGVLLPAGLRTSPLGPGWSRDLDAHVSRMPSPDTFRRRGWLCLDRLLGRLGLPGRGRWAVTEAGKVLVGLDLHRTPMPDPVDAVLRRCRRRGEVRAREALELAALAAAGRPLPRDPAVRVAAGVEAWLGGDRLARWAGGRTLPPPVALGGMHRLRRIRPRRRRRYGVAISGVDGAGKSALVSALRTQMGRAGVPVTVVWTRPGMGLGWLDRAARGAKRLLGRDPAPAVRGVASGEGGTTASRRGIVGWAWTLAVTTSFLRGIRRSHRRAQGVVLFDRQLVDALATLDAAYEGVALGLHRAVVRRLMPPVAVTLYLDVPAETAVRRKPDPAFGERFVRRQLEAYARWLPEAPGLTRLDATRPRAEVAEAALRAVLGEPPPGPTAEPEGTPSGPGPAPPA
jgi:thymidylate kinase